MSNIPINLNPIARQCSTAKQGFYDTDIFPFCWVITIIPSIVLVVLILSLNLLGDWLRDALNPRLYSRR